MTEAIDRVAKATAASDRLHKAARAFAAISERLSLEQPGLRGLSPASRNKSDNERSLR